MSLLPINTCSMFTFGSKSRCKIIIHPRWGVTAPAGPAGTGKGRGALRHGCLRRMLPDCNQWVWLGSVPLGLVGPPAGYPCLEIAHVRSDSF